MPLTSHRNVNMTVNKHWGLNLFQCWLSFATQLHWLYLVLKLEMMHQTFIYGDNSVHKFITLMFMMHHKLPAKSKVCTHLPAAQIYNYSMQSLTQNGCYVHCFLLRNTTILFNESFNKTLVCLISCSSWTSAMLLLIHCSWRPTRAFHNKHVWPNVERYSSFYILLYK